jgi:hypothetical protein
MILPKMTLKKLFFHVAYGPILIKIVFLFIKRELFLA